MNNPYNLYWTASRGKNGWGAYVVARTIHEARMVFCREVLHCSGSNSWMENNIYASRKLQGLEKGSYHTGILKPRDKYLKELNIEYK